MDGRFIEGNRSEAELNLLYESIENPRMAGFRAALQTLINQRESQNRAALPMPSFMDPMSEVINREFARKAMQPEIENPVAANTEDWICQLADRLWRTLDLLFIEQHTRRLMENWHLL